MGSIADRAELAAAVREATLRRATLRDLDVLRQLDEAVFGPLAYPPFVLRQMMDLHMAWWFLASSGEEFPGYIFAVPETGGDGAWILGVAVLRRWRGNGLGTRLTEAAMEALAEEGVADVKLSVEPGNDRAVRLYRKLGFRVREFARDYLGPGEHRFIMGRSLRTGSGAEPDDPHHTV